MQRFNTALLMIGAAAILAVSGCEGDPGAVGPAGTASCLDACHTDNFQVQNYIADVQAEFEQSLHNTGDTYLRRGSTNSPDCSGCHTTEGYQYRIANNGDTIALTQSSRIGCFACHAPHSNENFNLRHVGATDLLVGGAGAYDKGSSNTCAQCHQARSPSPTFASTDPITSKYWGPHNGTQANALSGIGAYEFSGTTYNSNHGHNTIENGCVGCHMAEMPADALAGGHSFKIDYIYRGAFTINDNGCQQCHSTEDVTLKVETHQANFQASLDSLIADLNTLGWLDADLEHVAPSAIPVDADARGAMFNFRFILKDGSVGVHNPTYLEAVLAATRAYVTSQLP